MRVGDKRNRFEDAVSSEDEFSDNELSEELHPAKQVREPRSNAAALLRTIKDEFGLVDSCTMPLDNLQPQVSPPASLGRSTQAFSAFPDGSLNGTQSLISDEISSDHEELGSPLAEGAAARLTATPPPVTTQCEHPTPQRKVRAALPQAEVVNSRRALVLSPVQSVAANTVVASAGLFSSAPTGFPRNHAILNLSLLDDASVAGSEGTHSERELGLGLADEEMSGLASLLESFHIDGNLSDNTEANTHSSEEANSSLSPPSFLPDEVTNSGPVSRP